MAKHAKKPIDKIADFFGGILGDVVKKKRTRKRKIEKYAEKTGMAPKKKKKR